MAFPDRIERTVEIAHPPASTAVQVVALVRPEFLLEVEAFALAGDGR